MENHNGKHQGSRPPRKKRPSRFSRLPRRQKILVTAAIVLAVLLLFVLLYRSLFVKPTTAGHGAGTDAAEEIDYGDGVRPRSDGERKSKDYYTVLILGRDTGGGGNTDTMLLASYDVTNQKATVMSIPRDTMVNVSWDIKRINSVYNYYGGEDKGIQALYKEISQLIGFEPDYQVVVEWEAVGKIVDAMGGVYFDVPRNMNYEDPYQDLSIHQTKGYRLLTGSDAMQVLRYRHDNKKNGVMPGYADGDLGRIKTQQAFLTAMVQQLLKLENLTKVNQFAKVFQENVETDLSFQNILWFAKSAYLGGLNMSNVNFVTMPNTPASCYSRTYPKYPQSYVVPNAKELLTLVNEQLSPFVEKFTLKDLDIMSVNSDGSISSSTGYVEDQKAASPPPSAVEKPEETPEETPDYVVDENGNLIDPETGEIISPPAENPQPGGEGTTQPTQPGTETPTPDPGTTVPDAGGDSSTTPGESGLDPVTGEPLPAEEPSQTAGASGSGTTTPAEPTEPGTPAA